MIDWILAERIAGYVAGSGDGAPADVDLRPLAAESERRVIAYTGLQPARPLPAPEGIGRREWVASNIDVDAGAARPGARAGRRGPRAAAARGAARGRLVLSAEVGVVLGYLAQRVLGQYELVLLDEAVDDRPPRLLFVLPNLGQAVQAFGADEQEFMTWVALHEVTHAVQFAGVPWLHGHMAGLVRELLRQRRAAARRAAQAAAARAARRSGGSAGRCGAGDMIGIVTNQAERETLDRVQAAMAVIEGHAEHVMDAVAPDLLPSLPKLRAALDRAAHVAVGALAAGRAGCSGSSSSCASTSRASTSATRSSRGAAPEALHHVFSGPEALPTLAELEDPAGVAGPDRARRRARGSAQRSSA